MTQHIHEFIDSVLNSVCLKHWQQWVKKAKHWSSFSPLSQVISYCGLVESFSFVEELSNVLWSVSEKLVLHQKHNALQKQSRSQWSQCRQTGVKCVRKFRFTFFGSMLNFFLPMATCLLFCRVLLHKKNIYVFYCDLSRSTMSTVWRFFNTRDKDRRRTVRLVLQYERWMHECLFSV